MQTELVSSRGLVLVLQANIDGPRRDREKVFPKCSSSIVELARKKNDLEAFRIVREKSVAQEGCIEMLHNLMNSVTFRESEALEPSESFREQMDAGIHKYIVSQASLSELRYPSKRASVVVDATPGVMSNFIETENSAVQARNSNMKSQSLAKVTRRIGEISGPY